LPKSAVVTTNMDGLEWTRSKYSKPVQTFLKFAEKLAVRYSDFLISDSVEIQKYIKNKYNKTSTYIPYGAEVFDNPDATVLDEFDLKINQYDMLIARFEPENSIEVILDGVVKANNGRTFLVIGNNDNDFGTHLKNKFASFDNIKFCGGIYDLGKLNNLRYFSNLYFHGHTVGGTNPSLLEAMASNSLICSNDNKFNRAVLDTNATYFLTTDDVAHHLLTVNKSEPQYEQLMENNKQKINELYTCDKIVSAYANHFEYIVSQRSKVYQLEVIKPEVSLENLS
jgi:glycosyltransferase involved in cell wall biosynthesis